MRHVHVHGKGVSSDAGFSSLRLAAFHMEGSNVDIIFYALYRLSCSVFIRHGLRSYGAL